MSGEERVREKFRQTFRVMDRRVWIAWASLSLAVRMRPRYSKELTWMMGVVPMWNVGAIVVCCLNSC